MVIWLRGNYLVNDVTLPVLLISVPLSLRSGLPLQRSKTSCGLPPCYNPFTMYPAKQYNHVAFPQ